MSNWATGNTLYRVFVVCNVHLQCSIQERLLQQVSIWAKARTVITRPALVATKRSSSFPLEETDTSRNLPWKLVIPPDKMGKQKLVMIP